MKRGIVGLVVLALAVVASPARADSTYGSVTGVDGVLFNDCLSYPYHYALVIPADAQSWTLDVTALGPDGKVAETDAVSNEEPVGVRSFFVCTRPDGFGTYTIHSTFHWLPEGSEDWSGSTLDDSTFTLRKPFTTTTVRASTHRPRHGELVTYRIRSFDERPTGYAPNGLAWVHLEKKRHGHWVRLKGGRGMTHSTGRVALRVRYLGHHERLRIRAVTEPSVRYAASASPTLRLW
jgi:hypothetical protein